MVYSCLIGEIIENKLDKVEKIVKPFKRENKKRKQNKTKRDYGRERNESNIIK